MQGQSRSAYSEVGLPCHAITCVLLPLQPSHVQISCAENVLLLQKPSFTPTQNISKIYLATRRQEENTIRTK